MKDKKRDKKDKPKPPKFTQEELNRATITDAAKRVKEAINEPKTPSSD
jgi:hypothetical protein